MVESQNHYSKKEVKHKRLYTVGSNLYEILEKTKTRTTESRSVAAKRWGAGEKTGHKGTFCSDKFLYFDFLYLYHDHHGQDTTVYSCENSSKLYI